MILQIRIMSDNERNEYFDGINRVSTLTYKNKDGIKKCCVQFNGEWNGKIDDVGLDDVFYDKGKIRVMCYDSANFHLE